MFTFHEWKPCCRFWEIVRESSDITPWAEVLCVSCPSATEYSAIYFFQHFRRTLRQNFNWIRQRIKNSPIDPQFLQWGLWGNSLPVVWMCMKFGTRVRLKRWNDRGEFELDRAESKNNIAENSVTLGHDTHNTLDITPTVTVCKPLTQVYVTI